MPPRKPNAKAKPTAQRKAAAAADDEDLDALLDAAIRENEAVPGSLAALRLEQEQREARQKAEQEQREARDRAREEAKYVCGHCGDKGAKGRLRCSVCTSVRYCDQACQTAHWPAHKLRCKELKVAAEAEAAAVAEVAAAMAAVAAAAEAAASAEAAPRATAGGEKGDAKPEAGNCWNCGADNPRPVCNGCSVAKYCNQACAAENWKIHKGRCAELKEHSEKIEYLKNVIKAGTRGLSRDGLNQKLTIACRLGRVAAVEGLVAAGASVNFSNVTGLGPLHIAALDGHFRVITVLVQHGALVDKAHDEGLNALHMACHAGQLKAAAALPHHGAQVDLPNKTGSTPLMICSMHGHAAVARLLLQHGAQIDLQGNEGDSPLYWASDHNHPEVVALLLQKGARVDLPIKTGWTPLMVSAYKGYAACVRLLLQAGADPLYETEAGDKTSTALEAAIVMNRPEVVALLQARIAEVAH